MAHKRPGLGPVRRAQFAENRIRRKVIHARIQAVEREIRSALASISSGSGKAAETKLLKLAAEKREMQVELSQLPVRRRPRKGKRRFGRGF